MHRTNHQRQADALRRLSKAVDRSICATTDADKARASRWAAAWKAAGEAFGRRACAAANYCDGWERHGK